MAADILYPKDAARFWAKVRMAGPDECWEWQGAENGRGYGTLHYGKQKVYAHRLSWLLENGPIPPGLFVCHTCDNPPCCNPAHLFVGTRVDNAKDMARKGRNFRAVGELGGRSKLTIGEVRMIRKLSRLGCSTRELAKMFQVGHSATWSIVSGKTWSAVA